MALVASVDGPNRRIYLGIDSVGVEIQPMDIYTEVRALRRLDESLRGYDMFLSGLGKILKIPGKYTERFVRLNTDDTNFVTTKIVPYDSGIGTEYTLDIIGTIISDQGEEGIDCFDRASLDCICNIYYHPQQVEILETGISGVTEQDKIDIGINVWTTALSHNMAENSAGWMIDYVKKITGNDVIRTGDTIVIYMDDNITPWRTYNLATGNRVQM